MREDKEQAYRDGYALGTTDEKYRRNWPCPYVTGAAAWAMARGYEAAWGKKRQAAYEAKQNN